MIGPPRREEEERQTGGESGFFFSACFLLRVAPALPRHRGGLSSGRPSLPTATELTDSAASFLSPLSTLLTHAVPGRFCLSRYSSQ